VLCRKDVISTVVSAANGVEKSGLAALLHADFSASPLFLSLPAASSCACTRVTADASDESRRGKTEDTGAPLKMTLL